MCMNETNEKRSTHAKETKKNDSQLFIAHLASCYTFLLSLRFSFQWEWRHGSLAIFG